MCRLTGGDLRHDGCKCSQKLPRLHSTTEKVLQKNLTRCLKMKLSPINSKSPELFWVKEVDPQTLWTGQTQNIRTRQYRTHRDIQCVCVCVCVCVISAIQLHGFFLPNIRFLGNPDGKQEVGVTGSASNLCQVFFFLSIVFLLLDMSSSSSSCCCCCCLRCHGNLLVPQNPLVSTSWLACC